MRRWEWWGDNSLSRGDDYKNIVSCASDDTNPSDATKLMQVAHLAKSPVVAI